MWDAIIAGWAGVTLAVVAAINWISRSFYFIHSI